MPDGFLGKPAFKYLSQVQEAHDMAVDAASQSPVGAPFAPIIIRLPYVPADAKIGSSNLGYNNSMNIVSDQNKYDSISYEIYRIDDDLGRFIYDMAGKIDTMCQTIFQLPTAVPRIMDITHNVRNGLTEFMTLTDEASRQTRTFAEEIGSIGGNGMTSSTIVWNDSQAENVRAKSEAALLAQANELRSSSNRFTTWAEELDEQAARIEARLPIMKDIIQTRDVTYWDCDGNERWTTDTYTIQVMDFIATGEARAQARELREQANELRRVAFIFVRAARDLQRAISTTNETFRQMHQEALDADRRASIRMDEIKYGIDSFTHRLQQLRDSFGTRNIDSSDITDLDTKLSVKSSIFVDPKRFNDVWGMIGDVLLRRPGSGVALARSSVRAFMDLGAFWNVASHNRPDSPDLDKFWKRWGGSPIRQDGATATNTLYMGRVQRSSNSTDSSSSQRWGFSLLEGNIFFNGGEQSSNVNAQASVARVEGTVNHTRSSFDWRGIASIFNINGEVDDGTTSVRGNFSWLQADGRVRGGVDFNQYERKYENGTWSQELINFRARAGASLTGYGATTSFVTRIRNNVAGHTQGLHGEAGVATIGIGGLFEQRASGTTNAYLYYRAMAYAAVGRTTGGINAFGLHVNTEVRGYAGAVGGTSRLGLYNGEVGGSFSAAIGYGAGFTGTVRFDQDEFVQSMDIVRNATRSAWDLTSNTVVNTANFQTNVSNAVAEFTVNTTIDSVAFAASPIRNPEEFTNAIRDNLANAFNSTAKSTLEYVTTTFNDFWDFSANTSENFRDISGFHFGGNNGASELEREASR
ncbi:MAG: hypothetical protein FWE05_13345 [Defluviitaleaceae bacterium]|nr:hypothetical protein [Defluviitaleaceae bacterium]